MLYNNIWLEFITFISCLLSINVFFSNEMQKMLECFGADITKTLIAKRKRLEQYTQSSLKTTNRKVEEIWKTQQGERFANFFHIIVYMSFLHLAHS